MRWSACALVACLAAPGLPAWAQVGDGPVPAMTAPPGANSSAPPSVALHPLPQVLAAPAPRLPTFAAKSVPGAVRLTADAREERRFLRDAAAQSRFELDASRLAFAKSGNAAVRTLAAALINHDNTVGLELAHLLNARGMAMTMISNDQRKTLTQLAKLGGGSKFDALYMEKVGLGQAAVARDYEKAAATIHDPQLNAWIVKTLATIRFHQDLAERAASGRPQLAKSNRAGARPASAAQPQHVVTRLGNAVSASSNQ
jgi:predicted outer membrane protein